MLWSKGMYLEHVRRMIGHLKRALRMERVGTLAGLNNCSYSYGLSCG